MKSLLFSRYGKKQYMSNLGQLKHTVNMYYIDAFNCRGLQLLHIIASRYRFTANRLSLHYQILKISLKIYVFFSSWLVWKFFFLLLVQDFDTVSSKLEEHEKKIKELTSENVKLKANVKIGQDALKQEQDLVKQLEGQLTQKKVTDIIFKACFLFLWLFVVFFLLLFLLLVFNLRKCVINLKILVCVLFY